MITTMKCYYSNGEVWEGDSNSYRIPHFCNPRYELHNENGPAIIESDGRESFYYRGKPHNFNGPAIGKLSGMIEKYFIYGEYVEKHTFLKIRYAKSQEDLLEYLLSNDSTIRFLAEYTLKRLEC